MLEFVSSETKLSRLLHVNIVRLDLDVEDEDGIPVLVVVLQLYEDQMGHLPTVSSLVHRGPE